MPSNEPESRLQFEARRWFKEALTEAKAKASKGVVVVCGGPGFGKSTLLRQLEAELAGPCLRYDPKNWDDQRPQPSESDPDGMGSTLTCLIDDLDVILEQSAMVGGATLRNTIHGVQILLRWQERNINEHRMVWTSRISFSGPLLERLFSPIVDSDLRRAALLSFSNHIAPAAQQDLNPWRGDWESEWKVEFNEAMGQRLGTLKELWRQSISRSTGGHPRLVRDAIEALQDLCRETWNAPFLRDLVDPSGDPKGLESAVQSFIQDSVMRSGMAVIRSSLRRLRESSFPLEKQSYEALLKIPSEGRPAWELEGNIRAVLTEEGLLHRDDMTGNYVVPGELIQQEIRRERAQSGVNINLVPSEYPDESGVLEVGDRRIELKGNPWRVLRILWDHRGSGEFLSIEQLKHDARNSLKRLRDELKDNDCAHLIENRYGTGYRFAPPL